MTTAHSHTHRHRIYASLCTCATVILSVILHTCMAQNGDRNRPDAGGTSLQLTKRLNNPNDITQATLQLNYERVIAPLQPVKTETDLGNLRTQFIHCTMQTLFTDGLDRPLQTVIRKPVLAGKDLVTHTGYDAFGRRQVQLLPYVKAESDPANAGGFSRNIRTDLENTYTALGVPDVFLYGENVFEPSPLNRVSAVQAPGDNWTGQDKGVQKELRTNDANEDVHAWTIGYGAAHVPQTSAVYPAGSLWVNITTDEDGNVSREYYDGDKLILKTAVNPYDVSASLHTYYVYDDHERLRYIIPPKAVAAAAADSWNISSDVADKLCFRYVYDELGRLSSLKKPGIGETLYVYDKKDQQVLSQDAMQRTNHVWTFTKYDTQGRMIQSGTFTGTYVSSCYDPVLDIMQPCTLAYTQAALQDMAGSSTISHPFLSYLFNQDVVDLNHYGSGFSQTAIYLSYYYDGYGFTARTFNNSFSNVIEGYDTVKVAGTGRLTGIKASTSSGAVLFTVHFYNARGELIQTQRQNLNNTWSIQTMGYDFAGRMTKSILLNGQSFFITKKYSYDAYGRLLKLEHKVNNATNYRTLAKYEYDDIGRLKQKTLGSISYPVKYDYNVRSWITGINSSFVSDKTNGHYFGMKLYYTEGYDHTYLNGRVAGMMWRNKGTKDELRSYGYMYDFAGRLTAGDYVQNEGADWTKEHKDFTATNMTYDENGNLLSMQHHGMNAAMEKIVLDELSYEYHDQSNLLKSVSDGSESTDNSVHDRLADFRDANGTQDYTYDANGNLTADLNRGIQTIDNSWFNINKPLKVEYTPLQKVEYIYDALGNLLTKTVTQSHLMQTLVTRFDYIDEMVYRNGALLQVSHDEGRIRVDNTLLNEPKFLYDYFIRDHIGNVRSIITEDQLTGLPQNPPEGEGPPGSGNDPHEVDPDDPIFYLATSEVLNNDVENALFENISETRGDRVLSDDPGDESAAVLNAANGKVLGPGILLKVMAGDAIGLGAEALYFNTSDPSTPYPLQGLVSSIITSLMGGGSALVDGAASQAAANINASDLSMVLSQVQTTPEAENRPLAYLNYIFFNEDMTLNTDASGALQVTQADGWDKLEIERFEVPQNGYVYIFTSNQGNTTVRTDNLYVMHWQGQLLEEFHYYPYGLTFEVNTATGVQRSNIKYNSQYSEQEEFVDADENKFGLDLYDFAVRTYDVQIGRWLQPDPMMQHTSPYMAMGNNPVSFTDPLGLEDGPPGIVRGIVNTWRWATGSNKRMVTSAHPSPKLDNHPGVNPDEPFDYDHSARMQSAIGMASADEGNSYMHFPATEELSFFKWNDVIQASESNNYLRSSVVDVCFDNNADNPVHERLSSYFALIMQEAYLQGIFSVNISATTNHSSNSKNSAHSKANGARAFDINYINGIHVSKKNVYVPIMQNIIQNTPGWLENYGPSIINKMNRGTPILAPWAREIKGGHYDHIHVSVPR